MGARERDLRFTKAENLLFWWGDVMRNGEDAVNGYPSESNLTLLTSSFSCTFESKPLINGPINRDTIVIIDRLLKCHLSSLQYLACKIVFAPGDADWRARADASLLKKTKYFELKKKALMLVVRVI